jgi:hypothetical protein
MKHFDALIATQKISALCEVSLLKNEEKPQKIPFIQKCPFFTAFLDFFRNGTL